MAKYIKNKKINTTKSNDVKNLQSIGKAAWKFVSAFYKAGWNLLIADVHNNTFRQKVSYYYALKTNPVKSSKSRKKDTNKLANVERLLPLIPAKTPKKINEISKFFKMKKPSQANASPGKSYVQTSITSSNTKNILKIKEVFPTLKTKNIDNIQRMIKGDGKPKPCINITTKGPSRKQVIVPMYDVNKKNFIEKSSAHIANMNKVLKNIKMKVIINFVQLDPSSIVIMTNKVTSSLDLQIIENYIINTNCINTDGVEVPRLPQSKSYLKIIGILYLQKNINTLLTLKVVEDIIKKNYIFNNIVLASRPHIIKVSPKLDMTIIWVDIWDI